MFQLSENPFNISKIRSDFTSEQAGALCTFEGLVRNHNEGHDVIALEYEAFAPLCHSESEKIQHEVFEKFPIIDFRCYHRVGLLKVSDLAVWIGVLSAHRDASFQACRYLIDNIKHRLPIWKKEFYTNGHSEWVVCEACQKAVE